MYHICDFNHVPNIMDASSGFIVECTSLDLKLLQDRASELPDLTCRTWLNFRDQYAFPSKNTPKLLSHLAKYDVFCFLKNLFLKTNLMNWQIVTSCLNKLIHKANNQNILLLGLIWVCLKIGYLQI
jgi:hypothetical protein